jgi:hypothetical protein
MMTAGTSQIRIQEMLLLSSWKLNPRSSQRLGNGCIALFGKANASLWLDRAIGGLTFQVDVRIQPTAASASTRTRAKTSSLT